MVPDGNSLTEDQLLQINELCNDYEAACKAGPPPRVETWLENVPAELHAAALAELLPLEIAYRQRAGDVPRLDELTTRFPQARRDWLWGLGDGSHRPIEIPEQLGDYRLLERIGGGGMGTVYKAVHQRMGRTVALKVLRPEIQRDPELLQRFDREVRAAARLTHPNIVAALDAREEGGLHYLITEFVAGCDLEETVRRGGPMSVGAAVECLVQAARGVDYAHRQGVVHRDIKPANLLRDAEGLVKVLDMGLARLDESDEVSTANLTKSGIVMGTAAYMAPEQARNTRRADARSDIYSLGCTLYFLLIGRPMFVGESAVDTILSHASEPIPSLGAANHAVPAELDAVFHRMVAKNPADRYQTAAEVIAALEPFRDGAVESPIAPRQTRSAAPSADTAIAPTVMLPGARALAVASMPATSSPRRSRLLLFAWLGLALLSAVAASALFLRPDADGYAVEFNGRSSYIAVRDLEPAADETYTIEVIAEPHEGPSTQPSNVVSWLGPHWMAIFLGSDQHWGLARLWQGEPHLLAARMPTKPGTKVHVAGVFQGGDLRLFVDGELAAVDKVEFALTETKGGLFIGGADLDQLPDQRFFHGLIHAVRISRGVRYMTGFSPPARLTADAQTLALFPFREGRGTQTHSSVGSWTGELVDAAWYPR